MTRAWGGAAPRSRALIPAPAGRGGNESYTYLISVAHRDGAQRKRVRPERGRCTGIFRLQPPAAAIGIPAHKDDRARARDFGLGKSLSFRAWRENR